MKVNRKQFAEILEVSDRQVGHYLNDGMPAERSGKTGVQVQIDTGPAIRWLIERAEARKQRDGESQRERLYREQADEKALANARERGQLIYREHVQDAMMTIVQALVSALEGLPGRLANEIVGLKPSTARARLLQEVRQVRRDVAEGMRQFIIAHNGEDPFPEGDLVRERKAQGKRASKKSKRARGKATKSN